MLRHLLVPSLALLWVSAQAQFVYPRPEYHQQDGIYKEDPFIVEYRQKFFAVFKGDTKMFNKAFDEITALVKKDPKDARALVWLGNGETVKAGVLVLKGQKDAAAKLLDKSRTDLDAAVALRPKDPNIYMMRAATLYIQGQYWDAKTLPKSNWEKLRDDCLKFIDYFGPKFPQVSIHVRGETCGELGIAYLKLGEKDKARAAFKRVVELCPDTDYSKRAEKELAALAASQ